MPQTNDTILINPTIISKIASHKVTLRNCSRLYDSRLEKTTNSQTHSAMQAKPNGMPKHVPIQINATKILQIAETSIGTVAVRGKSGFTALCDAADAPAS